MGLLRTQRFQALKTFQDRFFSQKAKKEQFSTTEGEFSAKQRVQRFGHNSTALITVLTLLTIPEDNYFFLTNAQMSVAGSSIDRADALLCFGPVITGSQCFMRLIPQIGNSLANSQTYTHPIRINPGDSIFLDVLIAQQTSATVFGYLIPKKEIDRDIIDRYG